MLPSISYMISRLRMIRSVSTSAHKDVDCGTAVGGCASRIVYLERTQRTKASHLLSYLFSVQYYFSSVISNRSRDQPQDSGLSVQRICSLPISYISWTPHRSMYWESYTKEPTRSWQQDGRVVVVSRGVIFLFHYLHNI